MSHIDGSSIYLDEFDETLDNIMIDIVSLFKEKIVEAADGEAHVEFWINSMGGDSHKAFALVDLMEWAKGAGVRVNTIVLSEAASSGSIVAVAGSKGYRRCTRGSQYMMHYGSVTVEALSPLELLRQFEIYTRHFNRIASHYADNSSMSIESVMKHLETDSYTLTGTEAVELGFADGFL